jgi:biotin carboxylase
VTTSSGRARAALKAAPNEVGHHANRTILGSIGALAPRRSMSSALFMSRTNGKRAVLIFPHTSYRVQMYVEAARRLGVELTLATDRGGLCAPFGLPVIEVDFSQPEGAAEAVTRKCRFDGVVATHEASALVAAHLAALRGLPHNDPAAARATRDKRLMRQRLASAGFLAPRFRVVEPRETAQIVAGGVRFPCVVKATMLSGSQGVIRADDPPALDRAMARVRAILANSPSEANRDPSFYRILVEDYLPGHEVAVEALMTDGEFQPLAIFDKPDALVGPYFEETLYITPSRHSPRRQERILDVAARAARALGLSHGPIHAELRASGEEVSVVEVAARSIGGLCSRVLELVVGSLEELILAHAVGLPRAHRPRVREGVSSFRRTRAAASGVMMMPIPRSGILRRVTGLEDARAVAGVNDVVVAAGLGQTIRALPEGSSYLGFIFAQAATAHEVEHALRASFAALRFELAPLLPLLLE